MQYKKHPPYQEVLFEDSSTGTKFIIGSTLQPKEKATFEGKEYPLCRVATSAASHPFFTKANQFIDAEGRVDKFTKKYQRKTQEVQQAQQKQEDAKQKPSKKKK